MKIVILIILLLVGWFLVDKLFLSKFKVPKIGALALVTGGVKCGKSTLSVSIVRKEYKQRVRKVKFANLFNKLFNRPLLELPLVYSNVPLSMPYVPLTDDLLLRKKRFVYGSVIYIQEASLVADSQLIRDMDVNELTKDFAKDDENLVYTTDVVDVDGALLVCESTVDSNGNTLKYYFDGDVLVRSDTVAPDGSVSSTRFSKITTEVPDSLFAVPAGYSFINLEWLMNSLA